MASFSFGAGNLAQLARIPLYLAGRLATLVIPRSRDEWVFGSAVGVADGALALWDVVADDGHRAIWLVNDRAQARDAAARGIPHVPTYSWRGLWRTARARVIVVTHGLGDANRYAQSGAFIVQLWHGIPLKRIGLDSAETTRAPGPLRRVPGISRLLERLYRASTSRISLIPAASHLVRGRLESAFGLPDERVPVTGEPRVDVLSRGTAAERRFAARAALDAAAGPLSGAATILYAPTWRDGEPDPAVPSAAEWTAIIDVLERRDAILLIRSHHLGAGEYRPPATTDRVRLLGSDVVTDVTPLLPGVDVLVTDYSSLAFDASLVPVPVIYLAPDAVAYGARRGFYGRFEDVAGDDAAIDWSEAAAQVDAVLEDPAVRADRVARSVALDDRVHAFRDGGSAARVYRAILAGLGDSSAARKVRA